MTTIDLFMDRNRTLAAQRAGTETPGAASLQTILNQLKACIITCADPRVDPAHVLGIQPGEAVVLRNLGGRVTPVTLEEMGLLNRIAEVAEGHPGREGEFHLIVLHHTDCGMTRLSGDPALLAHYFEIDQSAVASKATNDPRASVAVDVAVLRAIPAFPATWLISGLVYDVASGLVEVVVPPTPMRDAV